MGRQNVSTEVAACVRAAMARRACSRRRLSIGTGIPNTTLARKLAGHGDFTVTELAAIAEQLAVPGSSLLPNVLGSDEADLG